MKLTKRDLERIELKWECIRRSDAYRNDFQNQERDVKGFPQLKPPDDIDAESHLARYNEERWFIEWLPDPQYSIHQYQRRLRRKYPDWLIKTLGGLIEKDPRGRARPLQLESSRLRAIVFPEEYMRTVPTPVTLDLSSKNPRRWKSRELFKRWSRARYKKHVLDQIDRHQVVQDLWSCKVVFNARAPREKLCDDFRRLVSTLQKRIRWQKFDGYRQKEILCYLRAYDHSPQLPSTSDEARKFRRYRQKARKLMNDGWRLI